MTRHTGVCIPVLVWIDVDAEFTAAAVVCSLLCEMFFVYSFFFFRKMKSWKRKDECSLHEGFMLEAKRGR